MNLDQAKNLANYAVRRLHPYCERIHIAGSIRREKPEVHDIEIVCLPSRCQDLFGDNCDRHPHFQRTAHSLGIVRTGDPQSGKYIKVQMPEGINLDIFIASPTNYGWILALRTGPAEYSKSLVVRGKAIGYRFENGEIYLGEWAEPVPVMLEEEVFTLLGIPYIHPKERK